MAQSGFYNNPQFAQAAANLQSLFAPPSGSDAAGWSVANAKRAEAARLAELFDYAKGPNYNREMADRLGVAAGVYAPTQSYYKVGVDDARSGSNNAADNARALEQTRLQQTGETTRTMLGPVGAGATRFVPPQIADLYSVPQTQTGVVAAQPGERNFLPDGRVLDGVPKPLTSDELAARIMEGQISSGAIKPADVAGAKLGTPVQVQGPNGPTYASPGAAMTQGLPAYVKPDAGTKPTNGMAVLKDGTRVPAVQNADGTWRAAQTGAALPPDVQITTTPTLQGSMADVGLVKTTEAQDRAGYAGKMSEDATNAVVNAFDNGALPTGMDYQAFTALRTLPTAFAPAIISQMSPQGQLFYQNIRSALPYQLMAQSGQAVTEQEYERKLLELVPVPGEDPAVSQAKKHQFVAYGTAIRGMAGPAADKVGGLKFDGKAPPQSTVAPPAAAAPAAAAPTVQAPAVAAPPAAVDLLRKNPALAPKFDAKYGPGAAERALKGG